MNATFRLIDPAAPRLRFARAYFLAVGVLVFGFLIVSLAVILTNETLERAAILIMNVGVVMTAIVVSVLLLFAVRSLRRPARSGAVVGGIAFVLLVLSAPMVGPNAVIALGLGVVGIALAVSAWRAIPPDAGTSGDARDV